MRKIRWAIIVLMLAFSVTAVPAADKVASDPRVKTALEAARVWLEAQRAYDRIPGASAAIVYDQQVLWSGGYGFADLSKKTPAAARHHLQHLFDLQAVYQHRRDAAPRRRKTAS